MYAYSLNVMIHTHHFDVPGVLVVLREGINNEKKKERDFGHLYCTTASNPSRDSHTLNENSHIENCKIE